MVPIDAETGDVVAVLKGLNTPLILRRLDCIQRPSDVLGSGKDERVRLVGTTYVHGLMHGDEDVLAALAVTTKKFILL
jgi:hypothetical protein